jgi:hypothetical protein
VDCEDEEKDDRRDENGSGKNIGADFSGFHAEVNPPTENYYTYRQDEWQKVKQILQLPYSVPESK